MTSKISLTKLIANDLKRRSWLVILIALAGFFIYPVSYCMSLILARDMVTMPAPSAYGEYSRMADRLQDTAVSYFAGDTSMLPLIIVIAAVLTAYTGFSWLHSKAQTDFYAGMPQKRVHLFLVPYVSGILIAVIPYLVCALIALFGVGAAFGNVTPAVLKLALPGILWAVVGYLAVYTAAVLAMLLTGRGVLGFSLMGLILFYGPLAYLLVRAMAETSFDTYYSVTGLGQMRFYSPVTLIGMVHDSPLAGLLLIIFLVSALALCVFAMEKRPMERAEMPFVHPFIAPCVKVITGIPAAMFTGYLFSDTMTGRLGSLGWEIFWCFAAALVFNVVFEMVLSTDVKELLGHWRSAAVFFAGVLIFVCIFPLDLMGYDRFLPKEEEIESMAIGQDTLYACFADEVYMDQYAAGPDGEPLEVYLMNQALTEQFAPIYTLCREGVITPAEDNNVYVTVHYHLKSGRDVYRRYQVSKKTLGNTMTLLCENPAYRQAAYPFRYLDPADLKDMTVRSCKLTARDEVEMILDEGERKELAECLAADAGNANAGLLMESEPAGILASTIPDFSEPENEINLEQCLRSLYIYPQYQRTLAFLKDRGWVPMEQEETEEVDTVSFWIDDEQYVLTSEEDMETFFACTARPSGLQRMEGEVSLYYEIAFGDGYINADAAVITDQAAFETLKKAH